MKIRNGFVTNSSSSSFVLSFSNDEDVLESLSITIPYPHLAEYVSNDVEEAERKDIDYVIERIKDEDGFNFLYDYFYHNRKRKFKGDYFEWIETPEAKKMQEEYLNKKIEEVKSRVGDNSFFVEIEYEDHTDIGSLLEKDVMPNLPQTLLVFNHH